MINIEVHYFYLQTPILMVMNAHFHRLNPLFFSSNHKYILYNFYMEIQIYLYYYYQYLVYFFDEVSKMAVLYLNLHMYLYFILIIS